MALRVQHHIVQLQIPAKTSKRTDVTHICKLKGAGNYTRVAELIQKPSHRYTMPLE